MKLLHREDVEEAGYDMPTTGICANIAEFDLEELKFAGEWVLADDEVVVADGHQQQHLYVVVSGQVDVYKRNDQASQSQHIANIAQGDAFGEMAFLSGGVAAADVQATGQVVLWRIDHERLLEFVGQHRAGGQLCMNVASILSNRLVGGNRKLVDLGKKLQDSLRQLKAVSQSGPQNNKALQQMQNRVSGVTRAFAGKEVSKTKLGGVGIAAIVVASVSLLGLVISLATRPDGDAETKLAELQEGKDHLARDHGKLVMAHNQLKTDKNKLQDKLDRAQDDQKELIALLQNNKQAGSDEILSKLAALEKRSQNNSGLPEGPAKPPTTPPVEPPVTRPEPTLPPVVPPKPEAPKDDRNAVIAWAGNWSTVAFPLSVKAVEPFTLQSSAGGAKVPVRAGVSVYALRISGERLLVGLKQTNNTFTQAVSVDATNFLDAVKPRYAAHVKKLEERKANTPTNGTPFTEQPTTPPSTTTPTKPKPPASTSDHGSSCVCKDCRKKKKGGSLFPDLPGQ